MPYCRMGWRVQMEPEAGQQMLASPGPAGLLPLAAGCWDGQQVPRGSPTHSGGTASADGQHSYCPLSPWSKVQADDRNREEAADQFCSGPQDVSSPCTWSHLHPEDSPTLLNTQEPKQRSTAHSDSIHAFEPKPVITATNSNSSPEWNLFYSQIRSCFNTGGLWSVSRFQHLTNPARYANLASSHHFEAFLFFFFFLFGSRTQWKTAM